MQVAVVGTSHKIIPIEHREKLAFRNGQDVEFLDALSDVEGLGEAVVLSTCNRTEVYAAVESEAAAAEVLRRLVSFHAIDDENSADWFYTMTGRRAVRHLFSVASSLDSLVLGESQVNSQVKEAYHRAKDAGMTGGVFNPLFQRCFKAAKRVYTDTHISEKKISVSSVAVDLVREKLGGLEGRSVLVIGSGKIGKLSAIHFREQGVDRILVANRTREKSEKVAGEVGGEVVALEEIGRCFPQVDVVVGCTSAKEPILHRRRCAAAIRERGGRPLFILDLGVPRNVDPEVGTLEDVILYNIDQFDEIVRTNMADRAEKAEKGADIIDEEVDKAMKALGYIEGSGIVAEMVGKIDSIRKEELDRTFARLASLGDKEKAEVENLTRRLVSKLLHGPLTSVKQSETDAERGQLLEALRVMFTE